MGFVTGELELAFNLAVQYGQPEILIVEAGASVDDLDLPNELRNNIRNLQRFPLADAESEEPLPSVLARAGIVDAIESSL